VASGQSTVGTVEVLGGRQYTVRTVAFDRELSQTVNVSVGQTVTATVQMPTAKLGVSAVDSLGGLVDHSSVEVISPMTFITFPPKELELLARGYKIGVSVLGKETTTWSTALP